MFHTVYVCFTNTAATPRVITGPLTCFSPVNHPEIWVITQGPLTPSGRADCPLGPNPSAGVRRLSWSLLNLSLVSLPRSHSLSSYSPVSGRIISARAARFLSCLRLGYRGRGGSLCSLKASWVISGRPLGGAGERDRECGGFLIVGSVFAKLNWDSCGRDVPPATGVSSG